MEKEFFVLLFLDWSVQIAGKTTQQSIDNYTTNAGKLKIKDPVIFNHFPVEDKARRTQSVKTGIREIYPLPTDQKEMIFDANGLEIVSEILVNEGGEFLSEGNFEVKSMFSEYNKVLAAKAKRNSTIIPATADNVSEINKYKVKL